MAKKPDPNERVQYTVPFTGSFRPVFAAVNGENISVIPGSTVMIKRKFIKVLERAQEQKMAAFKYMQQLQSETKSLADF